MREDGTSKNFNGECSNSIRKMAPLRALVNTNLVTHPKGYNEPLPLAKGTGELFNHP